MPVDFYIKTKSNRKKYLILKFVFIQNAERNLERWTIMYFFFQSSRYIKTKTINGLKERQYIKVGYLYLINIRLT